MIAYIYGKIISKQPGEVIVETGGIGYYIRISHHTFDQLPAAEQHCTLHTHHHISENDQKLYGFMATEERNLFELLITVKSIGPNLALSLLSAMLPCEIVDAIVHQNSGMISRSPGIGKKSAERIVLELRDKLGDIVSSQPSATASDFGTLQNETVSALEALGYARNHAHKAVQSVIRKGETSENLSEMLKKALKHLQ